MQSNLSERDKELIIILNTFIDLAQKDKLNPTSPYTDEQRAFFIAFVEYLLKS